MRVKNYENGYCIVAEKYWREYEDNAFVSTFTKDEIEAEYIQTSLERVDRIKYVIVEV